MKIRKKAIEVEGDPYTLGMEDGFEYGKFEKSIFIPLPSTDPNGHQIPFIKVIRGIHYLAPDDWIITTESGNRYAISKPCLLNNYEIPLKYK
jgi:hypothetical protein